MISLNHIINPFSSEINSRFYFIQQITFQSMLTAQAQMDAPPVRLLSTQYPEDHAMLLPGFTPTIDLTRSVLDVAQFQIPRKLPILHDILQRAHDYSPSGYIIYTNVDIGLQPHFYQAVAGFMAQGYDAFVINRRTVSGRYTALSQMDQIYQDAGRPHRGWDCFVFPRSWIPDLKLGTICIGTPLVGLALLANLIARSQNFKEFRDEHLTFHLGDDKKWNRKSLSDYHQHNYTQLMEQLSILIEVYGDFPTISAPAWFLVWQSNPIMAALYRLYKRYPLPLWVIRKIRK